MSPYPNLKNEDPTMLIITTKDNEIKELKYKTEKQDHENVLKILKINNKYYKKKYKKFEQEEININYHRNFNW